MRALISSLLSLSALSGAVPAWAEEATSKPQAGAVQVSAPPGSPSADTAAAPVRKLRVGLALGGGGTRGAAHVGVLKVLRSEGVPIDLIAGTSMGSVVGGLFAAGVPLETIEQKFRDDSLMKSFMTVPLSVRILAAPVMILPRLVGARPYDGLYKGNKFRKYLSKSIPCCERNIEELKLPFAAVAVNVINGHVERISRGSLGYAMQASSAVPELRKPVQIGDRLYVDGGVLCNVPVNQARDMGADIVIAVDVDERLDLAPLEEFRHVGSIPKRMVKLQLATIDEPQDKAADIVIHPNVDGIGLISTKKKDADNAITAGENAAREALPAIKAKLAAAGLCCMKPTPDAAIAK